MVLFAELRGSTARNFFFRGYTALLPVALAMTSKSSLLPANVDSTLWKMNGWTPQRVLEYKNSEESIRKSMSRCEQPNEYQKELLAQLAESKLFWMALRKHLDSEGAELLLEVLTEHSQWETVKRRTEQSLRSEYQRLLREIRHYSNDKYEHLEMTTRREALRGGDSKEFDC